MVSKMPDRGNRNSILAAKNMKLAAFMFQLMEHCSKVYDIKHVDNTSVLQYQHQWELEQKKVDYTEMAKIDKNT